MKVYGVSMAGLAAMLLACGMAWADDGAVAPGPKLPFTVSKETTVLTSPLRADGTVDYVAALNEKYGRGATLDNNGFVAWLHLVGTDGVLATKAQPAILKLLGMQPEADGTGKFMGYGTYLQKVEALEGPAAEAASDAMDQSWQRPWKAEDHPHLAAYLKYEEKNLDLAREAAARPKWWSPYVGDSMIVVVLPSLARMREMANVWCARAMLRIQAGDFTGFLADVTAARQLARHVSSGATVIERLVGIAMEARACQTIGAVAGSGTLTAGQCAQLAKSMGDFGALPSMVDAVDCGERWDQLDGVRMLAIDGKLPFMPSDRPDPLIGIDPSAVDWDLVLRRVNREMDAEIAALKAPKIEAMRKAQAAEGDRITAWEQAAEGASLAKNPDETREAYSNRVAEAFMAVLMPSLGKAEELYRRAAMQGAMLRPLVAAAQIHAKTGKWPAKLDDLPLAVLKEVPLDAYSKNGEEPVRYLVTEKGLRLYSIGPNGADDGGVIDRENGKDDIVVGAAAD